MGSSVIWPKEIFFGDLLIFFLFFKKDPLNGQKVFFHRKVPLKIKIIYTFGPYFEKDPQKVRIRRIILGFF